MNLAPARARQPATTSDLAPARADFSLDARTHSIRMLGRMLDDVQNVRKAMGNRIGALERDLGDAFPELHVSADNLRTVESGVQKQLVRAWRGHPLASWAKGRPGIGKGVLIARLIAEIGHPYLRAIGSWQGTGAERRWVCSHYERRPGVGQLLALCGHGRPGRLPSGATASEVLAAGKPKAKALVYLLALAAIKLDGKPDKNGRPRARSPYRDAYEERRSATAGRRHEASCAPCHAKSGEPWQDGHKYADALRIVGKAILEDLYVEAKRLHEEGLW